MIHTRRIVIDLVLNYPEPISEAQMDAIASHVEQDASGEAASSFLLALGENGVDVGKIERWDVSSFTKDLDDGD